MQRVSCDLDSWEEVSGGLDSWREASNKIDSCRVTSGHLCFWEGLVATWIHLEGLVST